MKRRLNPFYRPAAYLTDRLSLYSLKGRYRKFNEQLLALSMQRRRDLREFYISALSAAMLLVVAAATFCAVCIPLAWHGSRAVADGKVPRPSYLTSAREENLIASVEMESEKDWDVPLTVPVHERLYSHEQAIQILEEAAALLEEGMLGSNTTRDEVRTKLSFPSSVGPYGVTVSYLLIPYGILSDDGTICGAPDEDGTLVEIRAKLSFQSEEMYYDTAVRVFPPLLSDRDSILSALRKSSAAADESSREDEYLTLPGEAAGRSVTWRYPSNHSIFGLLILIILLPLLFYYRKTQAVKEQYRMREAALALQFPDLVWKLSMLLSAGLTIRTAFMHIAEKHRQAQKRAAGSDPMSVYDELIFTCREMQSGVPEGAAYENFGKRCALPAYIKLGTLLSQSLKKGTEDLSLTLAREAETARITRLQNVKKLGQQAGTRLLFPMILMLGVVIIILMVPAMMSMYIS